MPLFDALVMVDWSATNRRRSGKADCIWIARGAATDATPKTESPASRTEAVAAIVNFVLSAVGRGHRVLVCADFAYGYPAGLAALLPGTSNTSAPWLSVWRYLAANVRDDLGTTRHGRPTNRSNRFAVANAINAAVPEPAEPGPFWCTDKPGIYARVPQRRPHHPFVHGRGAVLRYRLTDERAKSDTPFRLFGTGSVGSQALTGIPRLHSIRFDPRLSGLSAVWPFETGWAAPGTSWPAAHVQVVHAEIYPSVRAPLHDAIKDRGQVRAMWHWARDLDVRDELLRELSIPPGVVAGSAEDIGVRTEEGWILGCPM